MQTFLLHDSKHHICVLFWQDALAALKSGRLPPPSLLPSFETVKDIVGFPKYYEEEARYSTGSSTKNSSYSRMPG